MAGIDAVKRKLKFPPRFVPYLEKHRIFELLHEMAEELIMEQPRDHIKFLRDCVDFADKKRDRPRIVFISPFEFDVVEFSEAVARETGVVAIYRGLLKKLLREAAAAEESMVEAVEEEATARLDIFKLTLEEMTPMTWQERLRLAGLTLSQIKLGVSCGCYDYFRNLFPPEAEEQIMEEEFALIRIEEEEVIYKETLDMSTYGMCPCKYNAWLLLQEMERKRREEELEQARLRALLALMKGEGGEGGEGEGALKPVLLPSRFGGSSEVGEHKMTDDEFAELLMAVLKLRAIRERGWILVDMAKDKAEARLFARHGILPTHALHIITSQVLEYVKPPKSRTWDWDRVQSFRSLKQWDERHAYRMRVLGWKEHYAYVPVTEIVLGSRTPDQLAVDLAKMLMIMPHRHPPMMPRILLVGSRGSGTKTQAAKLAKKYHFVHIIYDDVTAKAMIGEDVYSEKYREQKMSGFIEPEVEAAVLEKTMLSYECLKHGWVLTGFPRNVKQFRMLDLVVTPPNRVIFVDVPPKECFLRVHYRRVDTCLGEKYRVPDIKPDTWGDHDLSSIEPDVRKRLEIHPRDAKKVAVQEIEDYYLCRDAMVKYCGRTAEVINGWKPIQEVFELVDQILINSAPAVKLRNPMVVLEEDTDEFEFAGHRGMHWTNERFRLLTRKKRDFIEMKEIESRETIIDTPDKTDDGGDSRTCSF